MKLPKILWPAKRGTLTRKQIRDAVKTATYERNIAEQIEREASETAAAISIGEKDQAKLKEKYAVIKADHKLRSHEAVSKVLYAKDSSKAEKTKRGSALSVR